MRYRQTIPLDTLIEIIQEADRLTDRLTVEGLSKVGDRALALRVALDEHGLKIVRKPREKQS